MAPRHRLRPTLADRQAAPAPEKVRVRFVQRHDVRDHEKKVIETFLAGREYNLPPRSAYRFVELLGKAVYCEDEKAILDLAEKVSAETDRKTGDEGGDATENAGGEGGPAGDEGGDANADDHSDAEDDNGGGNPAADDGGNGKKPGRVSRKR